MAGHSRTGWDGYVFALALGIAASCAGEDWLQYKFDARHSGDAPDRRVETPLGLAGAVPLTDAIYTAPVIARGRIYAVDGAGMAHCLDAKTLRVLWKVETRGGPANCNNISSPAIAGGYLHFGTMAGSYYVLDAETGDVVKEIACGEPIFSAPVAGNGRVYFATLGGQVRALEPDGTTCWTWDFVRERRGWTGDRWSGEAWRAHKGGRVTWRDQFCAPQDIALCGKTLVIPAGGEIIFLEDEGGAPALRVAGRVPDYKGGESPGIFGLSIGETGAVYVQWHRRDNTGRVEILRLRDGKMEADSVPGTLVQNDLPGSMGLASVSLRGPDVYRTRPEEPFGFCKHADGSKEPQDLGGYPSIASPILAGGAGVYGGLDGSLYVVPLAGDRTVWSYKTPFGCPISAPAAVCDGRIYFGGEDGYLYVLAPDGKAAPPATDLAYWKIRSPLTGKRAGGENDWFTNFGDQGSTNAKAQGIAPPFRLKWVRRYEGTFKHLPVCGGGRMYTHTAEGQIFAVEEESGRLLWRRYWPGVHISYTSPLYDKERLLVPQAGLTTCRVRCLDAATGALRWEAPFSGSPSWSRAQPPVVAGNLALYMFSTGKYVPKGTGIYVMRMSEGKKQETTEGSVSWLYSHDNPFYPESHRPLVVAWDMDSGKEVWRRDFSEHGSGGDDAGLCLMDGTAYYSCFFGYAAKRHGKPGPTGITCALDPATGAIKWQTTKYSVTAGCTISAEAGRLYVGGYNPPNEATKDRHVWCLDARDGSLIWQSEPLVKAINVVTVAERFIFAFAYGGEGYLIGKEDGKILSRFNHGYACTRFSFSEPYLVGSNMDLIDTSKEFRLVSTGPPIDGRECVGAVVSNGRIFYTSQASGLQASQVCGEEAASFTPPWQRVSLKP